MLIILFTTLPLRLRGCVRVYVRYDTSRIEIDLVSCLVLQNSLFTSIYTRSRGSIIQPPRYANLSPSLSFYTRVHKNLSTPHNIVLDMQLVQQKKKNQNVGDIRMWVVI
jgi:hypothetical protein